MRNEEKLLALESTKQKSAIFLSLFMLFVTNHQYSLLNFSISSLVIIFAFSKIRLLKKEKNLFYLVSGIFFVQMAISAVRFSTFFRSLYFFSGIALFFCLKNIFKKNEIERIILFLFTILVIVAGLQAIKMFDYPLFSPYSFFLNANFFAGFLLLCLPIILKKKIFPWGIYYIIICSFTHSRGLFISLVIGFFIEFIINREKKSLFLLSLFIILIFMLPGSRAKVEQGLSEKNYRINRVTIWKEAFRQYKNNPIFGNGWGSFPSIFLSKYPLIKLHAHSLYIEFLSSFGVTGIIFIVLFSFFSLYRVIPDTKISILVPLIPFFISQLFTNSFYSYRLIIFFFIVLAYLSSNYEKKETPFIESWEKDSIKYIPFFLILSAFKYPIISSLSGIIFLVFFRIIPKGKEDLLGRAMLLIFLVFFIRSSLDEIAMYKYNNNDYVQSMRLFSLENIVFPKNPYALFCEANSIYFCGKKGEAIDKYNKALEYYPYYDFFKANYIILKGSRPFINPIHPETNALLALYYKKNNDEKYLLESIKKASRSNVLWLFLNGFDKELSEYIESNIISIKKRLENTPDNPNMLILISEYYFQHDNTENSIKMARLAKLYAENSFQRFIANKELIKNGYNDVRLNKDFELSAEFCQRVFATKGVFQAGILKFIFH